MELKQFDKTKSSRTIRKANWPESSDNAKNVFDGRKTLRKMTVIVNHDLLARPLPQINLPKRSC